MLSNARRDRPPDIGDLRNQGLLKVHGNLHLLVWADQSLLNGNIRNLLGYKNTPDLRGKNQVAIPLGRGYQHVQGLFHERCPAKTVVSPYNMRDPASCRLALDPRVALPMSIYDDLEKTEVAVAYMLVHMNTASNVLRSSLVKS